MDKLKGKVAIVTGSGQGLGKAYAIALANAGASVAIVDLDNESANAVTQEIKDNGGQAVAITCDVGVKEQIDNAIAETVDAFGTIHILVNNAQGVVTGVSLHEVTEEQMEFTWRTGPLAAFTFMKGCFPYLKETGGNIINIFSSAGINGNEGMGAYASAKEAMRGLTRNAAVEWGRYNITVNVVGPFAMTNALKEWADTYPEDHQAIVDTIPMRRVGDPEEVAPMIVFLASDESKFITGQTMIVDGGVTFTR